MEGGLLQLLGYTIVMFTGQKFPTGPSFDPSLGLGRSNQMRPAGIPAAT